MARQRPTGKTGGAGNPPPKPWGSERPLLSRIREQVTLPLLLSIGIVVGGGLVLALFSWQEEKKEVQRAEIVRVETQQRVKDAQRLEEAIHKAEERIRSQIVEGTRVEIEKKRALEVGEVNYEQAWDKWYKPNPVCQRSNLKWKELVDCGDELIHKRAEFDALYRDGKLKNP
ncbi:MAG TPA: hypothetical protein VI457_14170 [Methylococcaceae bacterium]|nr:hypothetical protein [Methylococcaceae bacterium]